MSDLISRRALYDKCVELEQEALKIVQTADDKIEKLIWNAILTERSAFKFSVADAPDSLNNPSAEPKQKWIPVTEALPEEEKDVLVFVHFDGHKCSTVDYLPPSDYVEIASHVDGLWSNLSDEYKVAWKKHHVVAWMPTPEPWRGE